jgi:hypothetical protein
LTKKKNVFENFFPQVDATEESKDLHLNGAKQSAETDADVVAVADAAEVPKCRKCGPEKKCSCKPEVTESKDEADAPGANLIKLFFFVADDKPK